MAWAMSKLCRVSLPWVDIIAWIKKDMWTGCIALDFPATDAGPFGPQRRVNLAPRSSWECESPLEVGPALLPGVILL